MFTSYPVSVLFCELMNISGMHGRICSLTKFSESWMTKSLLSLLKFSKVWKKITFYSWSYILDVSDVAEWCSSRFWRSLSIFGNCLENVPPARLLWHQTNLHSTCTKTKLFGAFLSSLSNNHMYKAWRLSWRRNREKKKVGVRKRQGRGMREREIEWQMQEKEALCYFMGNRWGNSGNNVRLYFSGLQNHHRWWLQPWN